MKKIFLILVVSILFIQGTFADTNDSGYYVHCGEMSYLDNEGNCVCNSGYVREDFTDEKNLNCIKQDNYEIISCGNNSYADIDGKCACMNGYIWEDSDDNKNLNCKKIGEKTTYELTNKDIVLLEQFSVVIDQLSESDIDKLISFSMQLKTLLSSLNKNSRNYYLLNEVYNMIDIILIDG